ncbi:MAG TPA: hypothetical protein VGO00_14720 [Kofleriaceae bacterium]|nr:hypothetical protein [Kofleriaceae bacterium]
MSGRRSLAVRALQRGAQMWVISWVDNPHPISYVAVIALLVLVFIAWRRIRPPAHPLLRIYAGSAATIVFATSNLQTCAGVTDEPEPTSRFIVEMALVVIVSLALEIASWWRYRQATMPRAVARVYDASESRAL